MTKNHSCGLTISDLRLWVHLGCSEEEKYHPQLVSVTIQVVFGFAPIAVQTDCLTDTFCYQRAVESVEAAVKGKSFNLIEHLAGCIYDAVHPDLRKDGQATLTVTVTKMSPPVPGVHGGVSFQYSGQPPQGSGV